MSTSGYSRQPSLGFSDSGDEKRVDTNGGDYSTRMSELFDDDDDDTPTVSVPPFDLDGDDDDDDEEAFVYDGADAQVTRTTYREQLREVLDDDDDEDTAEEHEVERSLLHDHDHPPIPVEDEALVSHLSVQHACSMLISRGAHTSHLHIARHPTPFSLAPSHRLYTFAFLRISISFLPTNHVIILTERGANFFNTKTLPSSNDLTPALVHTPVFTRLLCDESALCFSRCFAFPLQLFHAFTGVVLWTPTRDREA
jgi:hypothetical protein